MKISMVGEYYNPNLVGGAEVQAMKRAEGLAKIGADMTVISFDSPKGKIEEMINGVKVTRYPLRTHKAKMMSLLAPIARTMHSHQTDLYHLYNTHPIPAGGLYKITGGGIPVAATLENYGGFCPVSTAMYGKCDFACRYSCLSMSSNNRIEKSIAIPYALFYPIISKLSKKLDKYIAVSKFVKEKYIAYGYPEERIEIIPNFIDSSSFGIRPRLSHKGVNILYVGRMSNEKGVDVLIRAFAKVHEKYRNTKLILVGSGPMLEQYRNLAYLNGLRNGQAVFTGFASGETVESYYSIADIFVHPAIWNEPFGTTVLEAMAREVPVLASNVGSMEAIVKDAGIIFEKGNTDDLADKLISLIDRRDRISALSKSCKIVIDEYTEYKVLKAMMKLYESMVER